MKRIITLLFVFASLCLQAQKSVLLRTNYNSGDKYVVIVETINNMGAQGGVNMKMTTNMFIANVNTDTISVESKISNMSMDMLQGGMTMSYDSSAKEEDLEPMGKMMKQQLDPMLKAIIYTKMNKQGELLSTRVEPAFQGMDQFNKSGSIIFPKEKVSVGSTWSNETEDQGMKMVTNYMVSKIENDTVFLDITGTVSGLGEGTINGMAEIDSKKGLSKKSEINMTISVQGNEMKISTKTTMEKV
ncbi:MAG: DUF6263 family protein [Polaribacter sp.]|nr:DUF6263 family protein [Polaribacter sp.]